MDHKAEKPVGYDVVLIYLCPKCKERNYIELYEAKTPGFKVSCCYCDWKFPIQRVHKVRVGVDFSGSNYNSKNKDKKQQSIIKRAIDILDGCGYNKKEAVPLINKVLSTTNPKNSKELVKKALKHVEPPKAK